MSRGDDGPECVADSGSRLWQWPVAWLLLAASLVLPLAACERDPATGPDVPLPTVLAVPTEAATATALAPPSPSPAIPTFRPTRRRHVNGDGNGHAHRYRHPVGNAIEPSPTPRPTAVFSAERAIDHVMALAREIGPRVAGEEGAELAAEYIADQFDSYATKSISNSSNTPILMTTAANWCCLRTVRASLAFLCSIRRLARWKGG